jgi:hypothetical protein
MALESGIARALVALWSVHNGLKHVWHPLGWPFPNGSHLNDALLRATSCKIVFIYRKNILKRVISHEIARQTSVWHADKPDDIKRRHAFHYSPIAFRTIESYMRNEESILDSKRAILKGTGNDRLEIAYETLFDRGNLQDQLKTLNDVLAFLGLETFSIANLPKPIEYLLSPSAEESSEAIYSRVPHIDEIESRFGSPKTGYLFKAGE